MSLEVQPFQPADLRGVVDVLADAMPVEAVSIPRFTRQVLLDPNFRPDGALVARLKGDIVGFSLAIARQVPLENLPPDAERGYITLMGVRLEHQRRGVGSRLLDAAEAFLREQDRKLVMISPYSPGYFAPGVDVNAYESGLQFFRKHGYQEMYRPMAMQASLWNLQIPQWIAERKQELLQQGVQFRPYEPELTLPLLEFAADEFKGDWVRYVRETATRILAGEPADRLIAAVENGRVIGFSHHDNERFGPIGTGAAQRGRGIGQVLMFETLQAQRAKGLRASWFMWSDDKTARRLYDSAGFKEVRRFALMKKELQ